MFILLYFKFTNSLLRFWTRLLFGTTKISFSPKSIIIWRNGTLGDAVCAAPAIFAIRNRFPDAKITLLTTGNGAKPLFIYNIISQYLFDNYLDYSDLSHKEIIKQIRAMGTDLFIELPQSFACLKTNFRNILFAKLCGVKLIIGYHHYVNKRFKTRQGNSTHLQREPLRLLNLLSNYGITNTGENYLLEEENCLSTLLKLKLNLDFNNLITISIGGKRESNKWPIAHFNLFANRIVAHNYTVAIIGGNNDSLSAKMLSLSPNIIDLTGKLTPMESADLIKRGRLLISNDTGTLHLGYALKTPVIGIFSNREYKTLWFPPETPQNYAFRAEGINCSNCFLDNCPHDNICTKKISAEDVFDKAIEILNLSK